MWDLWEKQHWDRFSLSTWVSPIKHFTVCSTVSIICHWGWYNMAYSGLSSTQPQQIIKNWSWHVRWMVWDSVPEPFVVLKPDGTGTWNHYVLHGGTPDMMPVMTKQYPVNRSGSIRVKKLMKIWISIILKYFYVTFIHLFASCINVFLSFVWAQ